MTDRSKVQEVSAVTTLEGKRYSTKEFANRYYYDDIISIEKAGQMAYVIWYQLWKNGSVELEIPAHAVMSVEYKTEPEEECPF